MECREWAAEWTRIRLAKAFGKWPHELDELDSDEYRRLLAFHIVEHFEATGEMPVGVDG